MWGKKSRGSPNHTPPPPRPGCPRLYDFTALSLLLSSLVSVTHLPSASDMLCLSCLAFSFSDLAHLQKSLRPVYSQRVVDNQYYSSITAVSCLQNTSVWVPVFVTPRMLSRVCDHGHDPRRSQALNTIPLLYTATITTTAGCYYYGGGKHVHTWWHHTRILGPAFKSLLLHSSSRTSAGTPRQCWNYLVSRSFWKHISFDAAAVHRVQQYKSRQQQTSSTTTM